MILYWCKLTISFLDERENKCQKWNSRSRWTDVLRNVRDNVYDNYNKIIHNQKKVKCDKEEHKRLVPQIGAASPISGGHPPKKGNPLSIVLARHCKGAGWWRILHSPSSYLILIYLPIILPIPNGDEKLNLIPIPGGFGYPRPIPIATLNNFFT